MSKQVSSTGQNRNKPVIPSLVEIVRRGLGTDFEAKATPMSAKSNVNRSTSPGAANKKY